MTKLSQKLLLLQLKTKDPKVFGRFYDEYVKKIYRFVYFKVSSKEEAEDLTAESFLRVWEQIFANKEIENLNAFTYQVARNLVIDHYRKKAQQPMVSDGEEAILQIPDTRQSIDKKMELGEQVEKLEVYLRQLKDEYREVLILKFIDELSVAEIAKILNKTNGNVRVLAHRALTTLRELTEKSEK